MALRSTKTLLAKGFCTDEHGYILGLVMIFFIIFTILGLSFIRMGGAEQLSASNFEQRTRAFYRAENGIQKGMWRLNHVSKAAATFSEANISVTYDSVNYNMVSVGTAGGFQDSIRVTVIDDGTFKIQTWEND